MSVSSAPSISYIQNLQFLYCNTACASEIKECKEKDDLNIELKESTKINNDFNMTAKYSAYFCKLHEDITDKLNASRNIEKGHYDKPISTEEHIFHLVVGMIGLGIPIVGIVCHHSYPLLAHALEVIFEGVELLPQGLHFSHLSFHSRPQDHYNIASELRGKGLEIFFDNLVADLTLLYRHEISNLTIKECELLASKHYEQIIECFTKINTKEKLNSQQIYQILIDHIDPNPRNEVFKHMNEYMNNRKSRWFYSKSNMTRETFLRDCANQLNENELNSVIIKISSQVFFYNDWIYHTSSSVCEDNSKFGLSNPYIKRLKSTYVVKYQKDVEIEKYEFNNPFLTSILHYNDYYLSLKTVVQKIVLILMRAITLDVIDNPDNKDKSNKAKNIIAGLMSPNFKRLNADVQNLAKRMEELETRQNNHSEKHKETERKYKILEEEHKILKERVKKLEEDSKT